jgi:transcriptional regulator EpsA
MSAHPIQPGSDPVHFMKIASQGAGIATHEELWRWLQGDVQQWLAHDIMLIGWGDFKTGDLHFDIVSSLAGMRSHNWTRSSLAPLISYFRDCWIAAQQQPCELDMKGCRDLLLGAGAERVENMTRMRTALVHGVAAGRNGTERIFAALTTAPGYRSEAGLGLKLLMPFMDSALRRMPPAPIGHASSGRLHLDSQTAKLAALSDRERQIMDWVAMGKTNPEIGCILNISEFTVKNHLKSIFGKLDVTNRAQAVSKLTRMAAHA